MVAAPPTLLREADEILPGVIADRRHFDAHPELGYQEFETAKIVAERLQSLGVEDLRTEVAKTGVTALIHGTASSTGPTNTALVRADMDALPIEEENNRDY